MNVDKVMGLRRRQGHNGAKMFCAVLECLTAACKALSLANGKGKGTNGLEIGSLDD
jgi:hypothetical protein